MGEIRAVPPRLQKVAELLAHGKNNAEIAADLNVQLHTAEKYVSDLKQALGCRDRVAVVMRCRSWHEQSARQPQVPGESFR